MYSIKIKRIYELPTSTDGYRMLVDRLWPRGITKTGACLNEWNKDIAPSASLRKWFGHDPERFNEFTKRYNRELDKKQDELKRLRNLAGKAELCLLYAAKDEVCNHAQVLAKKLIRK
ncbi:MAG TPA: DUF488 domain-containing protein [Cyclobacteriaceae bacterium]|jgi:uncharacterized protein YeaO (DUF488 family)|nr:DUF488 domain-containing protein [Cytophagales bacterium]HCR53624.1 DUF488 domain-containing protein [Cytophagales bacterium]HRE68489.1 DUF488 domain-containing protein [Cyclobacteriaceae bacterium]HRF34988.1 DUF488 domain-containing protein [Cyclobacteriaceae bacterium]